MKRLISFIALIFVLTACAPAISAAATTATIEDPPKSTATLTQIPATSTATHDPNMPEGATGKDKDGNWIKPLLDASGKQVIAENGQPMNETWLTFPSGPNGETVTGWFKSGTPDGSIPTIEPVGLIKKAGLWINVLVKEGIDVKYLHHPPTPAGESGLSFPGIAQMTLEERYFRKPIQRISYSESLDFLTNIFPDNYKISLTDAYGNPHTIYGDEKFTIFLVNAADIPNPDFVQPKLSIKGDHILSVTSFDDDAHSATILVAITDPNLLQDPPSLMLTLLTPYGHLLVYPDLSQKAWDGSLQIAIAQRFAYWALKDNPSYITLTNTP